MKILFLCDAFNPPAYLPRIQYFIHYFLQKGDEVTLISEKSDFVGIENIIDTSYFIDYYRFKNGFLKSVEWTFKTVLNLLFDHKGQFFYKKMLHRINQQSFDLIFCSSSFHCFPLSTADALSKKLRLPLFVDLRDILEQFPKNYSSIFRHQIHGILGRNITKLYKKINVERRNSALVGAKAIFCVSQTHKNIISAINPFVYTIYNGFDQTIFVPQRIENKKFILAFFGGIYSQQLRDPQLFFEALHQLIESDQIDKNHISVEFFTDRESQQIVERVAESHGILQYVYFKTFIPHHEIALEMNKASILLNFGSENNQYRGIMTTKLFEYIGVNRPILSSPSSEDELSATIRLTNCGLDSSKPDEIQRFIAEIYYEWRKNGYVCGKVDDENREKFSRQKSSLKMRNIIESSLKQVVGR